MHRHTEADVTVPAQLGALPSWYGDLLGEVKEAVAGARLRAQRAVNTELVQMYWQIGRLILARQEQEGWGTKVVGRLAADLKAAFPNQRGFSRRNLMYMQKMARTWPEPMVQQPVAPLPWGHVTVLMDKLETRFDLDFYAAEAVRDSWSRALLDRFIHHNLHLTQGSAATNFEVTVPDDSAVLKELARDQYRLDFLGLDENHAEHELEEAIVAHRVRFLTELGVGFAFVGRQCGTRHNKAAVQLAHDAGNNPLAVTNYSTLLPCRPAVAARRRVPAPSGTPGRSSPTSIRSACTSGLRDRGAGSPP